MVENHVTYSRLSHQSSPVQSGAWVSMDRQDLISCSSGLSKVMAASQSRGSVSHYFRDLALQARLPCHAVPCRAMQCHALGKGSNESCSPLETLPTAWQELRTSCWTQDNFQLPAAKKLHIMFVALTGIAAAQDAAVCSVVQVALVWCSSEVPVCRNSQPAFSTHECISGSENLGVIA